MGILLERTTGKRTTTDPILLYAMGFAATMPPLDFAATIPPLGDKEDGKGA